MIPWELSQFLGKLFFSFAHCSEFCILGENCLIHPGAYFSGAIHCAVWCVTLSHVWSLCRWFILTLCVSVCAHACVCTRVCMCVCAHPGLKPGHSFWAVFLFLYFFWKIFRQGPAKLLSCSSWARTYDPVVLLPQPLRVLERLSWFDVEIDWALKDRGPVLDISLSFAWCRSPCRCYMDVYYHWVYFGLLVGHQ